MAATIGEQFTIGEFVPPKLLVAYKPSIPLACAQRPWWVSVKLDGVRALIWVLEGGEVRIFGRDGLNMTRQFPELGELGPTYAAIAPALFDGEIVFSQGTLLDGLRMRQRIQELAPKEDPDISYYAFDILARGGTWLTSANLANRCLALRQVLKRGCARCWMSDPTALLPADATGENLALIARDLRERGFEGIVLKDPASPYVPGTRRSDWIKVKARR